MNEIKAVKVRTNIENKGRLEIKPEQLLSVTMHVLARKTGLKG